MLETEIIFLTVTMLHLITAGVFAFAAIVVVMLYMEALTVRKSLWDFGVSSQLSTSVSMLQIGYFFELGLDVCVLKEVLAGILGIFVHCHLSRHYR